MAENLVGFDSAWSDRKPGAICAVRIEGGCTRFEAPRPVRFDAAAAFIRDLHRPGDLTIVAIDQPTIVPNAAGARPAEPVVGALMGYVGGGIQPAYTGKTTLFGKEAPVWRFLGSLGFTDDPEAASGAPAGGFVMEVFPALAVLAYDDAFTGAAGRGPRYNPGRGSTFSVAAWGAVCTAAAGEARRLGLGEAAAWCDALDHAAKPPKIAQDKLDAAICLLVAARWRRARSSCVMVGDLGTGYIVAPASPFTRDYLGRAAAARAARGSAPAVPVR